MSPDDDGEPTNVVRLVQKEATPYSSDLDDEFLRAITIPTLYAMLERPVDLPPGVRNYIARRLLPVLEREAAAARGRPGAPGAGEMVQAFINSGMDKVEARKLVQHRTGLKYRSVVDAHHRFLKTGKRALLYARAILTRLP